jgi:hypothetical protein
VICAAALAGCRSVGTLPAAPDAEDSDYELLPEAPASEDGEAVLPAASEPLRPKEGSAARAYYDRLAYILGNLRETAYVHAAGRILDEDAGVYKYDCSGFVGDFILKQVLPKHYDDLAANAAKFHADAHPRAWGFYDYFKDVLGGKDEASNAYWEVFRSFAKVRPGDVIVVKYSEDWRRKVIKKCGHSSTGHVMTAWSLPAKAEGGYLIEVADSASSGHGRDTRRTGAAKCRHSGFLGCKCCAKDAVNGIGRGRMWFGTDKDGAAVSYRWSGTKGCKYTLESLETNCDGDGFCSSDDGRQAAYYRRLEGVLMARPKTLD